MTSTGARQSVARSSSPGVRRSDCRQQSRMRTSARAIIPALTRDRPFRRIGPTDAQFKSFLFEVRAKPVRSHRVPVSRVPLAKYSQRELETTVRVGKATAVPVEQGNFEGSCPQGILRSCGIKAANFLEVVCACCSPDGQRGMWGLPERSTEFSALLKTEDFRAPQSRNRAIRLGTMKPVRDFEKSSTKALLCRRI